MERRPRTALLQIASLALCAAAAAGTHWLVHGERVDDGTGVALTAGVTMALALALVASVRAATRGFSRRRAIPAAARLAGALVPLAILLIGAVFARSSLVDTSVAMAALVDHDRAQPASLAVGPDGTDVRLAGEITDGLAGRLAALLDANPRVARIHLTSDGGLADEGQALGDVIAAHGLTTFVPDYCVSACTLAFARGRERLLMDDARLGYHAPYEQGLFGVLYRDDDGGQRAAYLAAGIAPDFVDRALAVDPADIWFPDGARLVAARAVTRIVDHDTLPDSNLDGVATEAGARALVLRNFPLLHRLAVRRPAAMAAIADWYLANYRRGATEGDDARGLRLLVRSIVASALAHADEGVLRDLGGVLADALERTDEVGACSRIAGAADLVEAAQLHDADLATRASELLDRALRHDRAAGAPAVDRVAAVRAAAGVGCEQRRRDLAALLASPQGTEVIRLRLGASILRSMAALPSGRSVGKTAPSRS